MNIPELPFNLQFNHNGSNTEGSCIDVQPDSSLPGAFRFFVQTRRAFGMLPNEQVWLVNTRGARCKAQWQNAATSMGGATSVEFIAIIPDEWFAP